MKMKQPLISIGCALFLGFVLALVPGYTQTPNAHYPTYSPPNFGQGYPNANSPYYPPPQNYGPPPQGYFGQSVPPNTPQYGTGPQNVLFILDASGSMNDRVSGQSKIQAAKQVILDTIRTMPPDVNIGLRVYGHTLGRGGGVFQGPFGPFLSGGDACRQSELMVPLGINNRSVIAGRLIDVEAVGKTPITYSLEQAIDNDLANLPGTKTIILVSDGRETCSYNPCDYILSAVRAGVNIKINTVGFVTRDRVADDQLKCIALSTKGNFYSANTAAELAKDVQDSAKVQTTVQAKLLPGP